MKYILIGIFMFYASRLAFGQENYYPDTLFEESYTIVETRLNKNINLLWENHDTLATLACLDSLTDINKCESEPYFHKATIYQGLKDFENTLKNIDLAIDIASKDSKALYLEYITYRGVFYLNNEKYKNALNDFEYIFKFDRKDYEIDILVPLGVSYIKTGNKEKGCKILKRAVEEILLDESEYKEYCK